jgi:hypothetical protein
MTDELLTRAKRGGPVHLGDAAAFFAETLDEQV